MAPSTHVEQVLALARALYQRGAVPEALAIAREVFVSLWGRDELAELLPGWIRSLGSGHEVAPVAGTAAAAGSAMDLLGPALDPAAAIRALTTLSTIRPVSGAALAERTLAALHRGEHGPAHWNEIPMELRSSALGWEIASPVLTAARRQGLIVPDDVAVDIVQRLRDRSRAPLTVHDVELINVYASSLREAGQEEPGIRLAVAVAVASPEPMRIRQVIAIVQPSAQIRRAAEVFDLRGYPTEAVTLVMDNIAGMPVARDVQAMLEGTASSRAFAPVFKRRRSRGKPPTPPSPPPSDSKPEKSFFFLLAGDHAHRDQVVRAQSADLHFLYDIPSVDALARLKSKTLDELAEAARDGELIEIGVFILPAGFTFRGNEGDYKIVRIKGKEQLDPVVFKLRASDTPESDTGVTVVLTYNGAEVFQGFIRVAIVDAIDSTSPWMTPLVISKSTFDFNQSLPRDVTAFITTQDGQSRVSVRVGRELPQPAEVLNLDQLENAILNARARLAAVAESPVFRTMRPGRWGADAGQEAEFLGALCRMMTAGSTLYKFLHDASATSGLVDAIEALPDGAKITIFTDSAFVPWEIVFPGHFFRDASHVTEVPPGFAPDRLWGNRFEFETVMVFPNRKQNLQYQLPPERRQPGTLNIRVGVGAVEPDPVPGTPAADAALNAIIRHRAYCADHPAVAHWLDGSKELQHAFTDPDYEVSLLYLVCHGQNIGSSEQLDFGGYKPLPEWLDYERAYPGWPVVFINSCSIASPSPHVFDTFLRRFREKHAFGMIASSFPLPTRFATLFGCEFLEGYRGGARLGELLLNLRRRLLKDTNPLAFFYTLQCPLDVQRPDMPKES